MSSQICVDASVALKPVLDEEDSDKAHALWASWVTENLEIIAPCHLAFEATSVIRNHVYRGEISAEAGRMSFEAIHAQGIKLVHPYILHARTTVETAPTLAKSACADWSGMNQPTKVGFAGGRGDFQSRLISIHYPAGN